jgi:hypothetical protein
MQTQCRRRLKADTFASGLPLLGTKAAQAMTDFIASNNACVMKLNRLQQPSQTFCPSSKSHQYTFSCTTFGVLQIMSNCLQMWNIYALLIFTLQLAAVIQCSSLQKGKSQFRHIALYV